MIIIGVMGPGTDATEIDRQNAYQLGHLIAQAGWVTLSGGRNVGVMDAVSRGAQAASGLTIGILPGQDRSGMSAAIAIPIITGLGSARNNLNVLSSDIVIACGMGAGTASEVALALKAGKPVILLHASQESQTFFQLLAPEQVLIAEDAVTAIALAREILQAKSL